MLLLDSVYVTGCIYLLGSMAEHDEVRASLVDLGCIQAAVKTIQSGTIEIKRAAGYFLALLAEQTEYHKEQEHAGVMEAIVSIASTPDNECQEYSVFALAHLSGN